MYLAHEDTTVTAILLPWDPLRKTEQERGKEEEGRYMYEVRRREGRIVDVVVSLLDNSSSSEFFQLSFSAVFFSSSQTSSPSD